MNYRRKHIKPKIQKLKKKKKFFQERWFWIGSASLVIILSIFYVILFLPAIQIKKIEVSGNQKIESKDIEDLAWTDADKKIFTLGNIRLSSKSFFAVDSKKITDDILSKFPEIEDVQTQKKPPDAISVKITERKPVLVFCSQQNNCFLMDENGVIFESLKDLPQGLPFVSNATDSREVSLGKKAVDKNIIEMILGVEKNLADNFQVGIKGAVISDTLEIDTLEGWKIYFDPGADVNLQIEKMNALLKNVISQADRKKLQYIYLQYKDKAYYK